MYKFHNLKIPQIFYSFFTRNNAIHDYPTRQQNILHVPLVTTQLSEKCIRVTGVMTYDYFFNKIDMDCSYFTYKKKLKEYLIGNDISIGTIK